MSPIIFTDTAVATMKDWVKDDMALTAYDPQCNGGPLVFSALDLDMHTGRRSLREKVQGQMSEFDREYPW